MVKLYKDACLLDRGQLVSADILVEDSLIVDIAPNISLNEDILTVPLDGYFVSCAFADLHVHLREPGYSYKETIATGSKAGAAGGYACVCAMPNLNPVPDSVENLSIEKSIIDADAVIDVRPYCSITKGRKAEEIVDMAALKDHCIAFSDDGSGVQDESIMLKAMHLAAENDCIIAAHCEDNSLLRGGYIHDGAYCATHGHRGICSQSEWGQIERDLQLCAKTNCHYHVCHISTKESVRLIREAKKAGLNVSCETAPHYLILCDENLREDGRFKMNPPLRSSEDREALIEGLLDGTIDAIATDHAPHSAQEKSKGLEGSAMGITGLETAFPILYTGLVQKGLLSLERLVYLLSEGPRSLFRIGGALRKGESADFTVLDLNAKYRINSDLFESKGHSTPFDGEQVCGRVVKTIYKGVEVYDSKKTV